jgi:hypothetical protein
MKTLPLVYLGQLLEERFQCFTPSILWKEYASSLLDTLHSAMENRIQPVAVADQTTPRMNAEDNAAANVRYRGRKRNKSPSQDSIDEMINILRSILEKRTNSTYLQYLVTYSRL